jgi:hypothetical protein
MNDFSRRQVIAGAVLLGASSRWPPAWAAAPERRFDFSRDIRDWQVVDGEWGIEDVPGAEGGKGLVQRSTKNAFNVIVAPGGPWDNVDVSVRFKPISGREDESGGIVFRFSEGQYYVVRANALEDNFRFYYYDRGRHQIAGVRTKAPALGQWHALRIEASGDRIRGWLDDATLLEHRDDRFASGRVGLWTKADSVTAFDGLVIRPL